MTASNTIRNHASPRTTEPSYVLWLVIAWLWAGVPLAWGVTQTIKTSMRLFEPAPAATAAPATQPGGITR